MECLCSALYKRNTSMKKFCIAFLLCCVTITQSRGEENPVVAPAELLPEGKYQLITSEQRADAEKPAMLVSNEWAVVNKDGKAFLDMGGELIPFQFNGSGFLISVRFKDSDSVTVFSGRSTAMRRIGVGTSASPTKKEFTPFEGKFWSFFGSTWNPGVGSFRLQKRAD